LFGRKYTIDTVIRRAFHAGIQDLTTLADSYGADDYANLLRRDIAEIRKLQGVKWAKMNGGQRRLVMTLLTHAEQWEASLADSLHRTRGYARTAAESKRLAELFKHFRHSIFGKNGLEHFVENSITLTLTHRGLEYSDGRLYEPVRNV
jgi:hypothetical protein